MKPEAIEFGEWLRKRGSDSAKDGWWNRGANETFVKKSTEQLYDRFKITCNESKKYKTMGTNYYAEPRLTEKLKREIIYKIEHDDLEGARELMPEKWHIGKSSAGWQFLFNHHDWRIYDETFESLELKLSECHIINEYGEPIPHAEFWQMVKDKQKCSSGGFERFGLDFSFHTEFS